jgi:hypothetical protein
MIQDKLIPAVSKDLKILNTINQVVKKVYLHYFVTHNGIVFTNEKGLAMDSGKHFSYIKDMDKLLNLIEIPVGHVLALKSDAIFVVMRDHKKIIRGIKIENQQVSIHTTQQDFPIGTYIEVNDLMREEAKTAASWIIKFDNHIALDEAVIAELLDNKVVLHMEDDYKLRMTKTLFPHIKKGLRMTVGFRDDNEKPELFDAILTVTKDDVKNFHMYKCIRY